MTFLVGEKVKIVGFTDRFITAKYLAWLNDQEVNKYLFVGRRCATLEEAKNRLDKFKDPNFGAMFAITTNLMRIGTEIKKTDDFSEFIGSISLVNHDIINRNAEMGIMIGSKDHWGMGIAVEAIGLVADYGFNRLNLHKIEAGVVEGNAASSKAFLKNGFIHYGTIPEEYFLNGKYWSVQRFYKLQGK